MSETKIVSGKIASTKVWKTNKGFFLNLEGDSNDYYKFGQPSYGDGEEVELTVSQGTGNFSDKFLITQIAKSAGENASPAEKAQAQQETVSNEFKPAINAYKDTQQAIVEQVALKAAVELVKEFYPKLDPPKWSDLAEKTLILKDKFACNILEGEETKEEPNGDE